MKVTFKTSQYVDRLIHERNVDVIASYHNLSTKWTYSFVQNSALLASYQWFHSLLDSTSASYVPGSGINYISPGTNILRFLMVFLSLFRQMLGQYLKLGNNGSLPYAFQFSIHESSYHSTLYSLSYW
jgi:hypothetical protein